jgi:DNA-directed RNA polymerase subunit E'/Rpb7
MEQLALFEEKIGLRPKDMNKIGSQDINTIIIEQLRSLLEGKCSSHGYVVPNSLEILSRSIGHIDTGRYTGNIMFNVQAQGKVYNPSNGTEIVSEIKKKNKMGLYLIHNDAIRVLIPRDLHIGNEEYENLQVGEVIRVEIRKSRFQIRDTFILSVGIYKGKYVGRDDGASNE